MAPKKKSEQKAAAAKSGRGGTTRTRARTPAQLERQEKAYNLHIEGKTYREIGEILECDKDTVTTDIRAEQERRSTEIETRREREKTRAVNFYERIINRALKKSDIYDDLVQQPGAKVNDHSLEAALKARERIDKVLGIDAPVKVDAGLDELVKAINSARPE